MTQIDSLKGTDDPAPPAQLGPSGSTLFALVFCLIGALMMVLAYFLVDTKRPDVAAQTPVTQSQTGTIKQSTTPP